MALINTSADIHILIELIVYRYIRNIEAHHTLSYTIPQHIINLCFHFYYHKTDNTALMTAALHFAVEAGHDKIVELLIKHGINIDETTADGITALFNAVEKG
eukprot:410427_1